MPDPLMLDANLRDFGGAPAVAGRRVRRGLIYRSAALAHLDEAGLAATRALGIRTVVDLRRNSERAAHPTPWAAMGCASYWARDHDRSGGDHLARVHEDDAAYEDGRATMLALYAELPWAQAEAHGYLLRAIARGAGPVLLHCAGGKDRTGVAAALILTAAGVPRERVFEDYMLTARVNLDHLPHRRALHALPPERAARYAALYATDPAYLAAMFDALAGAGGIDAYLRDTLALDEAEVAALRQRLLEPSPAA